MNLESGVAAERLLRRRTAWTFLAATIVAAAGFGASHLDVRLAPEDFLIGGPQPGALGRLEVPDGVSRDLLILLVESSVPFDSALARSVVAALESRLQGIPAVRRVSAGLTHPERRFLDEFLPRNALLYLPPDSVEAIAARARPESIRRALSGDERPGSMDPLGLGPSVSGLTHRWQPGARVQLFDGFWTVPGRQALLVRLELEPPEGDFRALRTSLASIRDAAASVPPSMTRGPAVEPVLQTRLVGYPVALDAAYRLMRSDALRVGSVAVVVLFVILWLAFRRIYAPFVLLAPVVTGVLAAATVAALLLDSVSLGTWMLASLLFGLGVDFAVYIGVHYWRHGRGRTRPAALVSALGRPGPGIAVAALTTAGAFATVAVIPAPVTRESAVLTTVGLLAILGSSFTLLPLLLSFSRPGSGPRASRTEASPFFRPPGPLETTAWLLLLIAALAMIPGISVRDDQWRSMIAEVPEFQDVGRLTAETGVAFPPLVMRSTGDRPEVALSRDREAVRRVLEIGLSGNVAAVQSLSRWLPDPEQQRRSLEAFRSAGPALAPERIRRAILAEDRDVDPDGLERYMRAVEMALSPDTQLVTLKRLRAFGLGETADRHLRRAGGRYVATSYVYLRQEPWLTDAATRFVSRARRAGLYDLPGVDVPDPVGAARRHRATLGRSALLASAVAATFVTLLLLARFRRPTLVGLCLMPLVFSLGAALVVMRLAGVELGLVSITIAPILVGISVDDGIHVVDRLARGHSVATTLAETGPAMWITTLTSVAAFSCLALAHAEGLAELGLVGAVALFVALGAALRVVPFGWQLLHPRGRDST